MGGKRIREVDMISRLVLVIAALTILPLTIVAPLAGAVAAPQPLGLVASRGPVPLACLAGECAAELSAFCLQQARDIPAPGTRYRLAGGELSLIAIAADGKTRRIEGAKVLSLAVERGYSSVRVTVDRRVLEKMGAVRAAVEVGERVTLVPVEVAGDPDPLDEIEIAAVSGPLRDLGQRLVDNGGAAADAVRLTNGLINDLPERGRIAPATAARLWRDRIAKSGANAAAVSRAGAMVAHCQERVAEGRFFSLRRCIETLHDQEILLLNQRFWRAVLGS